MSPSTALPAQTADSTRSTASCLRAGAKSQFLLLSAASEPSPQNCRPRRDCRNAAFGFRHVGGLATRSASGDCRSPDRSSPGPSTTAHSSCNDILTHPGNGTRTTNSMPTTQPLRRRQPASSPRATPWRACPASALLHRGQPTQNHASTSMCLTLFVRDGINLVAHPLT
jgi:hypothetical protein